MKHMKSYVLAAMIAVGGFIGLGAATPAQAYYGATAYYGYLADDYNGFSDYFAKAGLVTGNAYYDYLAFVYADYAREYSYYMWLYAGTGSSTEYYSYYAYLYAYYKYLYSYYVYLGYSYDQAAAEYGYYSESYRGLAQALAAFGY